ncbi:hypothetical protein CS0771_59360 [Catellatospora sp. IY07-71]|nr:hypothetical protein CS0771_59360 [Catellatospora sp. IY07-71]
MRATRRGERGHGRPQGDVGSAEIGLTGLPAGGGRFGTLDHGMRDGRAPVRSTPDDAVAMPELTGRAFAVAENRGDDLDARA